jgi:cysteine desulfurase family protein (TIGR01976 family)
LTVEQIRTAGKVSPPVAGFDVDAVRRRYSSLDRGFHFFDAPGGTQVPDEVGDAMARALREASGNLGAPYETGRRVEQLLGDAKVAGARMLGCDPAEVVFGANMTTLNFALARTLARDLRPGDEIVVTRLDHDAGVAPWVELADDLGLEVRHVDLLEDLTLDYDDLESKLSHRTRVVAFAWASNAVGTVVDAQRVCALAHEAGALAWIDAVHYAAHEPIDVSALGADLLLCSAYKWCGPHLGLAYTRAETVETWRPFKARPSPDSPIGRRFETGTPPYELLAGLIATVDYLSSIGGFEAIVAFERALAERFLDGLPDGVEVYGPQTMHNRVPTFLVNAEGVSAHDVAHRLAERGYGVWHHDSWYSLGLRPCLPYDDEAVRIGLVHYNTPAEVDGLLGELAQLAA